MVNARIRERTEDEHEQYLTDCYGDVNICGLNYPAGQALRQIDPIAFDCSMSDVDEWYICDKCELEHEEEEDANDCCKDEEVTQ